MRTKIRLVMAFGLVGGMACGGGGGTGGGGTGGGGTGGIGPAPTPLIVPSIRAPTQEFADRGVIFDGSASTANLGIGGYDWNFGDGSPHGIGSVITHVYPCSGKPAGVNEQPFTVTLTVSDVKGNSNTATHKIRIVYTYLPTICALS